MPLAIDENGDLYIAEDVPTARATAELGGSVVGTGEQCSLHVTSGASAHWFSFPACSAGGAAVSGQGATGDIGTEPGAAIPPVPVAVVVAARRQGEAADWSETPQAVAPIRLSTAVPWEADRGQGNREREAEQSRRSPRHEAQPLPAASWEACGFDSDLSLVLFECGVAAGEVHWSAPTTAEGALGTSSELYGPHSREVFDQLAQIAMFGTELAGVRPR
jgi:hypothetical protein